MPTRSTRQNSVLSTARIATERAKEETRLSEFELQESHLTTKLEGCLEILGNAHHYYLEADAKSRRDLNQSIFTHLYVHDDDDIVANDLTPDYQLLMNDDLAATPAAERKREQNKVVRTSDFIGATEITEVGDRGGE